LHVWTYFQPFGRKLLPVYKAASRISEAKLKVQIA